MLGCDDVDNAKLVAINLLYLLATLALKMFLHCEGVSCLALCQLFDWIPSPESGGQQAPDLRASHLAASSRL